MWLVSLIFGSSNLSCTQAIKFDQLFVSRAGRDAAWGIRVRHSHYTFLSTRRHPPQPVSVPNIQGLEIYIFRRGQQEKWQKTRPRGCGKGGNRRSRREPAVDENRKEMADRVARQQVD